MARKFGRIYAYAEGDMHQHPAEMKKFFASAAAYSNNADLEKQNDHAMSLFIEAVQNSRSRHNGDI